MSNIVRNVKDSVKESARDFAGLAAAGAIALVLGAVAAFFLGWSIYLALSFIVPPALAAALVAVIFCIVIGIAYLIIRSRTSESFNDKLKDAVRDDRHAPVPPWAAYGIPADWPVDKMTQQLKTLGLAALGQWSARYSTRAALPLLAPALVGIVGFILTRRMTTRGR
jgi:hypothetical protein